MDHSLGECLLCISRHSNLTARGGVQYRGYTVQCPSSRLDAKPDGVEE